ncbi:uncharacterized protein LOC108622241 [Ceratina calcarata]|uniref:Uncharacterized protein LOC108622241 n=1 Tax=Ceratina calcarata TaxID=156304 RepID=A0AAJ7IRR4_9HYME|nr:uncharacterized protein LOC108622241 [Ceratina calcarata]
MAVNRLCAVFRQVVVKRQGNIIARYCSSQVSKEWNNAFSLSILSKNLSDVPSTNVQIKFMPKTLNIDFGNPDSVSRKNINELPLSKYIPSMEEPTIQRPIQQDKPLMDKSFELPTIENIYEKLAIRMIVIRRKKMKKHKRKKLRKKMHFVWAKLRAKRNSLREKVFQAGLLSQIKEAEVFDAKAYVQSRLALLDKEFIPRTYRGEILPQEMIKKFLQEKKEKRERLLNKPKLTLD